MTTPQTSSWHPKNIEEAILGTLRFFAIWNHPLRVEEIERYLLKIHRQNNVEEKSTDAPLRPRNMIVGNQSVYGLDDEERSQKASEKGGRGDLGQLTISSTLTALLEENRLITDGMLYTLHGHESAFAQRKQMQPVLDKRLKRFRRYAPLLMRLPFVRGVFLCNNLSFGIATEKGDIDLFIVTAPGHIFMARFLCTALFHFLGIRRHGKKTTNRFCLSFYATEDCLDFSSWKLQPQDVYLTYWTLSLIPCSPTLIAQEILEKNRSWLQNELGMVECPHVIASGVPSPARNEAWQSPDKHMRIKNLKLKIKNFFEFLLLTSAGRWAEQKITVYQKNKLTRSLSALSRLTGSSGLPSTALAQEGTVISDRMLKFHDRDRRGEVQERWTIKE